MIQAVKMKQNVYTSVVLLKNMQCVFYLPCFYWHCLLKTDNTVGTTQWIVFYDARYTGVYMDITTVFDSALVQVIICYWNIA